MPELTRRTVLEGMSATGVLALVPTQALGAALPEPPLDIEGWFGDRLMAEIKRVWELGKINVPEKYRFRPPLLTPEGRFNISASFRYAFAKLLDEGPNVLCPDEPGLHDHYRSVLRKVGRNVGIPVSGIIGELRDQPGVRMMMLTRDRWLMMSPRSRERIEPFSRYQWLGRLERDGFITPERDAPPRPADEPAPRGRAPTADELFSGNYDPLTIGRLPPEPEAPPPRASPDLMMTVTLRIGDATITAYGPETVLGERGQYFPDLEETLGIAMADAEAEGLTVPEGRLRISPAFRLALRLFVAGCPEVDIAERADQSCADVNDGVFTLFAKQGFLSLDYRRDLLIENGMRREQMFKDSGRSSIPAQASALRLRSVSDDC